MTARRIKKQISRGKVWSAQALTALSPGFSTLVHVTWSRSFLRVSLDTESPPFARCRPFATGLSSMMAPFSLDNGIATRGLVIVVLSGLSGLLAVGTVPLLSDSTALFFCSFWTSRSTVGV